jgi:hypothetical protein
VVLEPDGTLKMFEYEGGKNFSRTSSDGGRTWSERKLEYEGPAGHLPLVDRQGEIHLVAQLGRHEGPADKRSDPGVNFFIDVWHVKSRDGRTSWEKPKPVWQGYCGSINGFTELKSGRLLLPFAQWMGGRPEGPPYGANEILVMYSDDGGTTWKESPSRLTAPCYTDFNGSGYGACEPCVIELENGRCYMLARTETGMLYQSYSQDGIHWAPLVPSPFLSTDAPAGLLRIPDGRILVFFNGCEKPPRVSGAGVYGGRDVLHAAVSDDDTRSWRGFREVYRDPTRNESPQRRGDRGTAYPFPYVGAHGKVIVVTGQGRSNGTIMFDPEWLLETRQADDFSAGLDGWSVFKAFGPASGWWRDRRQGPLLVDHPDKPGAQVLHVRRPDEDDGDGAVWNFPLGNRGHFKTRIKLQPGFAGACVSLLDRFFDPQDPQGETEAVFKLAIAEEGRISLDHSLAVDRWQDLDFRWDLPARTCMVSVDGEPRVYLKPCYRRPLGINYVRFRSTAARPDTAGLLIERVDAEIDTEPQLAVTDRTGSQSRP